MSLSDELYRETILDHYHHPRNQGTIETPTVEVDGVNPLCGDELTLFLEVSEDNTIKDVKIKSRGCSINTASASMMTELIAGQSLLQAEEFINIFKNMMLNKDEDVSLPEEMEELEALQGVKRYPVRIKCALLPWNTLLEGIETAKNAEPAKSEPAKGKKVTTE
jgi:nitrogen fixation protein NifU and related proteins